MVAEKEPEEPSKLTTHTVQVPIINRNTCLS